MNEFVSLARQVRWRVRQIEVVIEWVLDLVWNVDGWVVHVELFIELVDVQLLAFVLQLFDRLSVLIG